MQRRPHNFRFLKPAKAAFTLIELMVVMTIIVLILGMAVPVVRSLEGNRSLETAYNRVSAALAHARQTAIYFHAPSGVVFFRDPTTGLQDIGYVAPANYIAQNFSQNLSPSFFLPTVMTPTAIANYVAANTVVDSRYMELIPGEEIFSLPTGLAVQVSNGNGTTLKGATLNGGTVPPAITGPSEQFLRVGIVLFDENGELASLPYWIAFNNSVLGFKVGLATNLNPAPPAVTTLYSHPAVCIYDETAFTSQISPSDGNPFQDFNGQSVNYYSYFGVGLPSATDEYAEQLWLQQNGQIYVIRPNDGSLLRNQ